MAIRPTMIETPASAHLVMMPSVGINGNQTALGKDALGEDALSGHQWQSDRTW
jgi:hypothetical protein